MNITIENLLVDYLSGKTSFNRTVDLVEEAITKQIYEELLKKNDSNKKTRRRIKNMYR
jgi:hypothetical protein